MTDMIYIIQEGYENGEITKEAARDLILKVDPANMEFESAIDDMNIAEVEFMESAINYAKSECDAVYFEAKAATLTDKIKAAWLKFKAWVKKIKDSVFKKICDLTGTYHVDKQKWTLLQKIDSALKKGYNAFLPKAQKLSNMKIDQNVENNPETTLVDCFSDAIKLVASATTVTAVKVSYEIIKFNIITGVIMDIGKVTDLIVAAADKSNNAAVKCAMKVIRPVLNMVTSFANGLRDEVVTAKDYRANKKKYDKDTAMHKALADNHFKDDAYNRTYFKVASKIYM